MHISQKVKLNEVFGNSDVEANNLVHGIGNRDSKTGINISCIRRWRNYAGNNVQSPTHSVSKVLLHKE